MMKIIKFLAGAIILYYLTSIMISQTKEAVTTAQQNEINLNEIKFEIPQIEEKVNYSKENNPIVTMNIKDYGTVKMELYPEVAPNTVNNFIELVKSGFYNGLTFHRVVNDFVIQGGDPLGNGMGDAGYSIEGEFIINGHENYLSHEDGVISMARSSDVNSASSQFFIVTGNSTFLDGQYAGFGKVIEGMEFVKAIENVDVDDTDKPLTDVVIENMTVDTKGIDYVETEKIYPELFNDESN